VINHSQLKSSATFHILHLFLFQCIMVDQMYELKI